MNKSVRVLLCLLLLAGGFEMLAGAGTGLAQSNNPDYMITVNGEEVVFNEPLYLENGRIYVPVRFVSESLEASLQWKQTTRQLDIHTSPKDQLTITIGSKVMTFNGVEYVMDVAPLIRNDRTYLPLRHISEFLHTSVFWNDADHEADLREASQYVVQDGETLQSISNNLNVPLELLLERNGLKAGDPVEAGKELKVVIPLTMKNKLDQEEVELMAKIIHLEAGYEPFEGQVAVGNVVMNRVESSHFPNTIREVIYQPGQFSPVRNGRFEAANPSPTSYLAAREVFGGTNYVKNALYFYNPRVTRSSFFTSREAVVDIGNHRFIR